MGKYDDKTLLSPVPTSILWKLKLWLTSILWVTSSSPTRKTWDEFYCGLIDHECEFDFDNLIMDEGKYGHYECKHYGCNMVSVQDRDGNWV